MTQLQDGQETNPEEVSNQEVVETKEESTTPKQEVDNNDAYRKLQSQLDKERAEREKLAKDAEYYRNQLDTRISQEEREQILKEQKAREAEERAEKFEQELMQERSSKVRDKLISEKYPYLNNEALSDIVSSITGTEEEISSTLSELDKKFRAVAPSLAQEESSKEEADPISSKVSRSGPGVKSYDEFEKLSPEAQKSFRKKAWDDIRSSFLGK